MADPTNPKFDRTTDQFNQRTNNPNDPRPIEQIANDQRANDPRVIDPHTNEYRTNDPRVAEQKAAISKSAASLKAAEAAKATTLKAVDTATTEHDKVLEAFNTGSTETEIKAASDKRTNAYKALKDARDADEKASFDVEVAKAEHKAVEATYTTRQSNEWNGARFTLLDTNSDGIPNAIVITPIDTKAEGRRRYDEARYAPYHQALAHARATAAAEHRGSSAEEITTAVDAAVDKAKADWKGPVPLDILRAEAEADFTATATAVAEAKEVAAEKKKAADTKALAESQRRS